MKAWLKIEEKLNKLLTWIGGIVMSGLKKSTPKKLSDNYKKTLSGAINQKQKLKDLAREKSKGAIKKAFDLKEKSTELKVKAITKAQNFSEDAKNFNPKEVDIKKNILIFLALFLPIITKSKAWLMSLKPVTLIGAISTTTIVGLTAISFYSQVEKISEKMEEGRDPSSIDKKVLKKVRAVYHKKTEKELKITNMNMPIYVGESKKLKTVNIDFTMVSSNKYIPNFFFNRPYYLRDKMNSSIHPFIPELPLNDEGKIIIKAKIKKELNILLKKLHIKGEIQEVHIHSLLAG